MAIPTKNLLSQEMGLSNGVGKIFIEKKKSGQVIMFHLSTLFVIHIYVYQ